jgi:hypothetical protein
MNFTFMKAFILIVSTASFVAHAALKQNTISPSTQALYDARKGSTKAAFILPQALVTFSLHRMGITTTMGRITTMPLRRLHVH